jgi:ferritin-like protein
MAASSAQLHEDNLPAETIDRHRAIVSIMEELEAVDWYDQRAFAATDDELRAVLEHNRDEEKEHAAMALEWLRRRDPKLDEHLRTYLFTEGALLGLEKAAEGRDEPGGGGDGGDGSLGIGSLAPARQIGAKP